VAATSGLAPPLSATLRMSLLAIFFFLWQLLSAGQRIFRLSGAGNNENPPAHKAELFAASRKKLVQMLRTEFALDRRNLLYLLLSGFCFGLYNLSYFYGLSVVFSNQGGILTSVLVPIFSLLLYGYLHKTRLRCSQIVGLFMGLFGTLVLSGGLSSIFAAFSWDSAPHYWQISLFIITAFTWSCITQLSSKVQQYHSLQKYSFYAYFFAALWTSWGWFWFTPEIQWLPLLGLIFVGSILGTSLYFLALRFLRPSYAASYLFLNPILIGFMGWWFLSEPWSLELILGGLLAVLAIILLNKKLKSRITD
ncbi:MAG: DMT family transporter, partial [Spirochaetota bacterium]